MSSSLISLLNQSKSWRQNYKIFRIYDVYILQIHLAIWVFLEKNVSLHMDSSNRNNLMIRKLLGAACFLTCMTVAAQQTAPVLLPYQNPKLAAYERAKDLCGRLTIEEKTLLMMDRSPAIERLGIPEFHWWNEALHGVGRNGFATVFPITMGMAASFDDALVNQVFTAISDEARAKNTLARHTGSINRYQGLSYWTPNINIFRDPRWGRGQETYGEDPYLTTRMGLAVVAGLQGDTKNGYKKLLACAKHFAVHSGPEWNRHSFNVENLPPRDLWETYMPAFKALVQEGQVAEVMCAYQRLEGEPCCGSTRLLQQILRQEWGFKGIVTSDCSGINDFWMPNRHGFTQTAHEASAKAVRAGTDVECGSQYATLPEAIRAGEITEAEIDTSLIRLLTARFELGDFDPDELNPWTQIPMSVVASKEHKALALQMARESIVMLKNNGILPFSTNGKRSPVADIVVMGPNANDSVMQWGNYSGYPTATTTVLEGIRDLVGPVRYIQGCGHTRNEVLESRFNHITEKDTHRTGMKASYWNNAEMKGEPVAIHSMAQPINQSNGGATVFAPGVNLENFSARYEGTFVPDRTEDVTFALAFDDGARLIINGDTVADIWKSRARIQYINKDMRVEKGKQYDIKVEFFQKTDLAVMQFDIVHKTTPTNQQILAEIGEAQTVVFVGGISPRLEGEEMKVNEVGFKGGDRTDIELPLAQREMMQMLHQAGKKVVFVNCSGSAIAMVPELENTDAIIQAWYPGEEGGAAVAEVLFGKYNPSGKLPITFYKSVNDLPDFMDYHMENRTYRYFKGEPLFPFGYGLSYTTFDIKVRKVVNGKLQLDVTNTGKMAGTEVVQLYIRHIADKEGPLKTLRGFKRISLKPREKKTMEFDINKDICETWDSTTNTMRFVGGQYEIMVGTSSREQDLKKVVIELY